MDGMTINHIVSIDHGSWFITRGYAIFRFVCQIRGVFFCDG